MSTSSKQLLEEALSEEEQRELYDRLAYKFSQTTGKQSAEESEVWDALHEALKLRYPPKPFAEFCKVFGRAKFRNVSRNIVELISSSSGKDMRKNERISVLIVAFECLAERLQRKGIPATPAAMLNNSGSMQFAIDQNFPGYCNAKLLHRIIPFVAA